MDLKSNKLVVILDNGHGIDTPGKRSPDGRFREYRWCRDFVKLLENRLKIKGIETRILVPEESDISLSERVRRVNSIYSENKKKGIDTVLISIHNNAAGNGKEWKDARGFTGWVYTNASKMSRKLGSLYAQAAKVGGLEGNRYIPSDGYFTANFYILKNTHCPAILIENGFMDNKEEVDFLLSKNGVERILNYHENSILNYIKYYNYTI